MCTSMAPIALLVILEIGQMVFPAVVFAQKKRSFWVTTRRVIVPHLSDSWNLLEVFTYSLMLAGASSFLSSDDRGEHVTAAALCGSANVLATLNLLGFLRTTDAIGQNIRMLIRITSDIGPFLKVQLIFILGFTMAFAVLLPDQPRFQLPMALLTSYDMMLGAWDLEQFEAFSHDRDSWVLTTIALVMFVVYTIVVLVVAMK